MTHDHDHDHDEDDDDKFYCESCGLKYDLSEMEADDLCEDCYYDAEHIRQESDPWKYL